jgi:hypothetical protein
MRSDGKSQTGLAARHVRGRRLTDMVWQHRTPDALPRNPPPTIPDFPRPAAMSRLHSLLPSNLTSRLLALRKLISGKSLPRGVTKAATGSVAGVRRRH